MKIVECHRRITKFLFTILSAIVDLWWLTMIFPNQISWFPTWVVAVTLNSVIVLYILRRKIQNSRPTPKSRFSTYIFDDKSSFCNNRLKSITNMMKIDEKLQLNAIKSIKTSYALISIDGITIYNIYSIQNRF